MHVIADLQLHSRFSRAVSPQMTIPNIALWASRKGIGLVATGDWTHPLWMREIKANLEETGNGLLRLKKGAEVANENFGSSPVSLAERSHTSIKVQSRSQSGADQNFVGSPHGLLADSSPLFLLATEVSCIYSQGGRGRRVHTLIWVPSLASADKISQEMTKCGCNLLSDGRPIVGLTSIQLAELVLSIEPKALIIPAHAWTPWFSLYGSMSGFDSINEAFGPYAKHIYAVETGLSSSPAMNWRIKELDNRSIVSFSDAHSGPKLGREATVFEVPDRQLSYEAIYHAIRGSAAEVGAPWFSSRQGPDLPGVHQPSSARAVTGLETPRLPAASRIAFTIEFYPEEGKYHYTGHRACNVRLTPGEAARKGSTCAVCGKPLTQGVMQRVEELACRSEEELQLSVVSCQLSEKNKAKMIGSKVFPRRPPFVSLVPLQEIIGEAIGSPVASVKTQGLYTRLTDHFSGEFTVLLTAEGRDIAKVAGERVARGIEKVRNGDIVVDPGYDGVFGVVKIWKEGETVLVDKSKEQLGLF